MLSLAFKGTTPRLTTDGSRKPYRAFVVEVALEDGSSYRLSHLRFSDFSQLDAVFHQLHPIAAKALPPFPRKTLGKPTEAQWLERVRQLEIYFNGVLALPTLAQNPTFVLLFSRHHEDPDAGMRAAIYNQFGQPRDVVRVVANLPKPAMPLKANDVFIEVYASSVNPTDVRMMEGASDVLEYMGVVSFPFTPGVDVSGIVRGIGAEVTGFAVGDAVFADTGIISSGAFAEYCVVPDENCAKKPRNMSFVEAAAFPRAGLVAYQTLVHDLRISTDGERKKVLILGGHTGSGSIGIQIAKYFGCHVSCTVQGEGAEEWARRLGADHVALAQSVSWWVADQAHWGPFDAIFDTLGEEEGFERAKQVLVEGGAFATEQPEYLRNNAAALSAWFKQGAVTAGRKIMSVVPSAPSYYNAWAAVNGRDLEAMRVLIEGGDFKTVTNKYFSLEQAAEALDAVRQDGLVGKISVQVKSDIEREASNVIALSLNRPLPPSSAPKVSSPGGNSNLSSAGDDNAPPPPYTESAPPSSTAKVRDLANSEDEYEDEPASLANPFG